MSQTAHIFTGHGSDIRVETIIELGGGVQARNTLRIDREILSALGDLLVNAADYRTEFRITVDARGAVTD